MRRAAHGVLLSVGAGVALAAAAALAEVPPPPPRAPQGQAPDGGVDGRPSPPGEDPAEASAGLAARPPVDLPPDLAEDGRWVFVDKSDRLMVVNAPGFREVFRVALGPSPTGPKEAAGDGRTPEGEYYVCHRVASDRFHRFLGLSYPGPDDAARAALAGLLRPLEVRAIARAFLRRARPPWGTPLGGNVGIHGWGRRRSIEPLHALGEDWTDGCVGVTNDEVERIYPHVALGTRVVIGP